MLFAVIKTDRLTGAAHAARVGFVPGYSRVRERRFDSILIVSESAGCGVGLREINKRSACGLGVDEGLV